VARSPRAEAPTTTSEGDTNERVEQVRAQLNDFEKELGGGFEATSDAVIDALKANSSTTFEMEVLRGVEYVVFAACDNDCGDVDLFAYDSRGSEITRDIEPGGYPVLQFEAPQTALWSVKVEMV
jgi:hypothetical protein